jgi:hypothetical protein
LLHKKLTALIKLTRNFPSIIIAIITEFWQQYFATDEYHAGQYMKVGLLIFWPSSKSSTTVSKKIFLEVLVARAFVLPPATNQNTPESSQPYLKSDTTTICLITPKPD